METATKVTDKVEVQVVQTKLTQAIIRTLIVPQMSKLATRVVFVNGQPTKMDNNNNNNKLILPTKTPKIKVVDTFEDKTTKTWERDFELSARLIANDINLR